MFACHLQSFSDLIYKLREKNPVKICIEFFHINLYFLFRKKEINQLFFFPFYTIGGAERVHASILGTVAKQNPVSFISSHSTGKTLYNEFAKNSKVLHIEYLLKTTMSKKWLNAKILMLVRKNKNIVLFGCNVKYFYELVDILPEHVKKIDLVHAFVHNDEEGPENWSLRVVNKLIKRVVINKKTAEDFKIKYTHHFIDPEFLKRIVCIPNFVKIQPWINKTTEKTIRIIYVGRDSKEKRVHLIAEAAAQCAKLNLPIEFHLVGNLKASIPNEFRPYCIFHNEVQEVSKLEYLYHASHVLLLASSREGFPLVIMEAMMHGVVPLVTAVGGIPEHIKNNFNGLLIEETLDSEIVKSFISHLKFLLLNRQQLDTLSHNAYNYAVENFSEKNFTQSYKQLLLN